MKEEKEVKDSENLLVLYGSQTGTAEDVAERVAREGMQHGLKPFVSSMNDFKIDKLALEWSHSDVNRIVIFIAATTGQGDTPDNMKEFWKFLCKAQWGPEFLSKMKYGVIGLGDSSYEKYNFVGKKLYRRLRQLGATPKLDICLGDDQHDLGYHAAVSPWMEKLWTLLGSEWNLHQSNIQTCERISKFQMKEDGKFMDNGTLSLEYEKNITNVSSLEMRKVIGNERVTSKEHWQDTRLITIDLEGSSIYFNPGDVLVVQPSNLPENVEKFFEIFPNLRTMPPIYIQKNTKLPWSNIAPALLKIMGPQPWTWNKIVTHLLDIQSVPRLYFFELMSTFAENELEKEKLLEFCSPQGQEDLFSYCNRPKRNILEVLEDFHNTTQNILPIYLFDLIPAIKSRSFSIASSRRQFPNALQILVAVVEFQTKIKSKRRGLCSNWLAHYCPEGSLIPVWIQKGSLTFPLPNENAVVIMIGPGTGVAPFRSIITERKENWNKWLFFGCRNEKLDFYFEEEWKQLQEQDFLIFRCAFSRDSDGKKRKYVQDKILEEASKLKNIFSSKDFYIYVAGNAKEMPKDVQAAVLELMKQGGIEDTENFMEQCSRKGRYQTETWS